MAAGWAATTYREDRQAYLARLRSGSRVIRTQAGTIEYALRGQGPPMMVVHGGGGGYDQALVIAQKLGRDFQVIAPSRFGFLRSPFQEDNSPAAQADLFAALLDHLKLDKIAILGESAGGPSSIQFALRYPDRCAALLLVSAINQPLPATFNQMVEQMRWLASYVPDFAQWLLHKMVGPAAAALLLRGLKLTADSDREFLDAILQAGFPISERLAGTLNDFDHFKHPSPAPLEEIRVPTLVVHGTGDALVPYAQGRAAAERIPQAEFISIPGGSHIWMATHAEQHIPQMLDFLRTHAPRSEEVD